MQTKISFLFAALFVLCACNSSTVESGDLGPHDDGTGTQSDMQSDSPTDAPVASDAPQNGPCGVCGEQRCASCRVAAGLPAIWDAHPSRRSVHPTRFLRLAPQAARAARSARWAGDTASTIRPRIQSPASAASELWSVPALTTRREGGGLATPSPHSVPESLSAPGNKQRQ